jgi:hypothetical protein
MNDKKTHYLTIKNLRFKKHSDTLCPEFFNPSAELGIFLVLEYLNENESFVKNENNELLWLKLSNNNNRTLHATPIAFNIFPFNRLSIFLYNSSTIGRADLADMKTLLNNSIPVWEHAYGKKFPKGESSVISDNEFLYFELTMNEN